MLRFVCILLMTLLCCAPALASAAAPQIFAKGEKVVVAQGGKEVTMPKGSVELVPVENSDLRYISVNEDTGKEFGLVPGIYIFDPAGKLAAHAASEAAEYAMIVSLSPGGTALAMDSGIDLIRDWHFFSYPAMEPLGNGPVSYYQVYEKPAMLWVSDAQVLFTTIDTESTRACGYDPCGPTSVQLYTLATGKAVTLLEGTEKCDYAVTSLADGTVTASELCLSSGKDWEDFPGDVPTKAVTKKLP